MKLVPRVLILENETGFRRNVRDLLTRSGCDARIARSVTHLVSLVDSDHFDAAIVDIRLSEHGSEGLDAIKMVRKMKPEIYVEVLTAYMGEFRAKALELGADAVTAKGRGVLKIPRRIREGILKKRLAMLESISGGQLGEPGNLENADDNDLMFGAIRAATLTDYIRVKEAKAGLDPRSPLVDKVLAQVALSELGENERLADQQGNGSQVKSEQSDSEILLLPPRLLRSDVRSEAAIVSGGMLVAVSDHGDLPDLDGVGDKRILKIPDNDIYACLDFATLEKRYRELGVAAREPKEAKPADEAETLLVEVLLEALDIEAQWDRINRRRFHLILKKHTRSLSVSEGVELDDLQQLVRLRSSRFSRLPFSTLSRLEELARKMGL